MTPEFKQAIKKLGRRELKKMVIDIARRTELLSKKDIGAWRVAWQRATDGENANRCLLYDIYTDVEIDMHVTGCVGQRKGFATKKGFKIVDKNGRKDDRLTELFETEWFDSFVSLVLDSRYYGHSLIEFGGLVERGGKTQFDYVSLVPRRHVIPEYGVIVRDQNDTHRNGTSFREGDYAQWCIEVGGTHDLGLFLKCAPSALSKKNMMAFWDGFGEIFGMPIRIAKTTSYDEKDLDKIENMLSSMGAAFYGLFPEGTDVEIKETSRGDAYNVYDKRIDRANSEISKGLLNQTMTIDSGSSLSQSEVHLEVFENVIAADEKLIRNVVNNKLIPFMIMKGFPLEGCQFEWDDTVVYTPEHIREVERMLINGGYEIDPKYFQDKYGIEITGKREMMPALKGGDADFFV